MITDREILDARILIVDDQPANVSLLELLLSGAGYTAVTCTTDPRAVLELHGRNRYSAILLDLQMPGMDGFAVMDGLRQAGADDYLPVLVITAQPGHQLRALEAGARDFISKPFQLAVVLRRVRNLIEARLLHAALRDRSAALERSLLDVTYLYDQVVIEQKLSERLLINAVPDVITVRPDAETRPLVPEFLARRNGDVACLTTAIAALDFAAAGRIGHAIKETGRGYGFDGLTLIGSAIERAAHHLDADSLGARAANLAEYLQRVHIAD